MENTMYRIFENWNITGICIYTLYTNNTIRETIKMQNSKIIQQGTYEITQKREMLENLNTNSKE